MFYDTEIKVLNNDLVEIKTIVGDLQPYEKVIKFEDNMEIEIKYRVFCDIEPSINDESYLMIKDNRYKVIEIIRWSDYLVISIFKCNG